MLRKSCSEVNQESLACQCALIAEAKGCHLLSRLVPCWARTNFDCSWRCAESPGLTCSSSPQQLHCSGPQPWRIIFIPLKDMLPYLRMLLPSFSAVGSLLKSSSECLNFMVPLSSETAASWALELIFFYPFITFKLGGFHILSVAVMCLERAWMEFGNPSPPHCLV